MDGRRTQTEPKHMKVADNVQGLTSEIGRWLYLLRKERGRGISSIENSKNTSLQDLEDYIKKKERLIAAANNSINNWCPDRNTRKQKWGRK